jgi:AcrR family transcriptional regulator
VGWKARTLSKSLGEATARSLERGSRFVEAARAVVMESQQVDFTVQEVVARSGLSLRSFYQHFEGKEALLLALYEELVEDAARRAEARLSKIDDHEEKLRFLVGRFCQSRPAFPSPTNREVARLLGARPRELRLALEPVVELFAKVIGDAMAAGVVRDGDARAHAVHLLLVLMMHTQARSQGLMGESWPVFSADELWGYCRRALCAD